MTTKHIEIESDDYERVPVGMNCPRCGEDDTDALVWIDDAVVRCDYCKTVYDPNWTDVNKSEEVSSAC